jgi:hypothetical protein
MLLSAAGCKSTSEEAIEGIWGIDTILKDGQEFKGCFGNNIWEFDSNGSCVFPTTMYCSELNLKADAAEGTWKFDSGSRVLVINSANKFFGRSYRVDFVDDMKRKMLVMKLTSDSSSITCRKALYVYNKKEVSELVNHSQ